MAALLSVHVNINNDFTAGLLTHNYLFIPPPMAPVPTFAIEMIALQMWTAGYLLGQNKFTTTVKHKQWNIVIEGHDIGMLIPDITIPFVNQYYAIMWPFSSRKLTFETSMVKMNGKMVGCSDVTRGLPMMTCGDPISAPTTFPILNMLNTVKVGMSLTDLMMGILAASVSILIDAVFAKLGGGADEVSNIWRYLGKEALGKLVPLDGNALMKKLIGTIAGGLISWHDPRRPAKMDLKLGMPGVAEVGVEVQPGDASVGGSLLGGKDNRARVGQYAEGHVHRDASGEHHTYATGGESGSDPWNVGTRPSGS